MYIKQYKPIRLSQDIPRQISYSICSCKSIEHNNLFIICIPMRSGHPKVPLDILFRVPAFLLANEHVASAIYCTKSSNNSRIIISSSITMEFHKLDIKTEMFYQAFQTEEGLTSSFIKFPHFIDVFHIEMTIQKQKVSIKGKWENVADKNMEYHTFSVMLKT